MNVDLQDTREDGAGTPPRAAAAVAAACDATPWVPDACLQQVLSFVDETRDLVRCSQVSRQWLRVARSPVLWATRRAYAEIPTERAALLFLSSPYAALPSRLQFGDLGSAMVSAVLARAAPHVRGALFRGNAPGIELVMLALALCGELEEVEVGTPAATTAYAPADRVAALVRACPRLRHLALSFSDHAPVAQALADPQCACGALESLSLRSRGYTDDAAKLWAPALERHARTLRSLSVACDESWSSPMALLQCAARRCPGLESLAVEPYDLYDPQDLTAIAAGFPRLRSLALPGACLDDLARLAPLAPTLRELRVSGSRGGGGADDEGSRFLLKTFDGKSLAPLAGLRSFSCDFVLSAVKDPLVALQEMPLLGELYAPHLSNVQESAFVSLVRTARSLQVLDLSYSAGVTDAVMAALGESALRLRRLAVVFTSVTGSGLVSAVPALRGATHLLLHECDIGKKSLEIALAGTPRVRFLSANMSAALCLTRRHDDVGGSGVPLLPQLEELSVFNSDSHGRRAMESFRKNLIACRPRVRVTFAGGFGVFCRLLPSGGVSVSGSVVSNVHSPLPEDDDDCESMSGCGSDCERPVSPSDTTAAALAAIRSGSGLSTVSPPFY